jgi:methylenetetrahydrofolate dehydrogenase (NADP+)/methenyltetrahydrofolate cyclohydrolase
VFIQAINPIKDVDGLSPNNRGLLFEKEAKGFIPCTPLGILHLIRTVTPNITGQHALIIGRSLLVGQPLAHVLLNADATVTVAHSHTHNLQNLCRSADILIAAVGSPGLVRGSWIKPGAIVIDVGINRIKTEGGKSRLVGDVAYDEAKHYARAITPVPGGVGPMTVTYLLFNTLKASCIRRGLQSSFYEIPVSS